MTRLMVTVFVGLCFLVPGGAFGQDGVGKDSDGVGNVVRDPNTPIVRYPKRFDISKPLRDIVPVPMSRERHVGRDHPLPKGINKSPEENVSRGVFPHVDQTWSNGPLMPATLLNFEGGGDGLSGFSVTGEPPDTNGDVGQNYYMQWLNTAFTIFNKSDGSVAYGPADGNTLFSGFGGRCESDNDGDPVVKYDQFAQRWVVTQFAVEGTPYTECVAVSQTSDPTGSWYRYAYNYSTSFNDYPKISVWPDGYYITYNMFANGSSWAGGQACVFERSEMLNGGSAREVCFGPYSSYGGLLPSDVDGPDAPPAGSPNYFIAGGNNALLFWKFHVDWANTSNSTFSGPTSIGVTSFSEACGGGTCIPTPQNDLDSLADRLMFRFAYRNFGDHESLVVNHSITGSSADSAIRWYEIRDPSGTPTIHQSGTYEPDSSSRWMGSIAMDHMGNMALGYGVSDSSSDPSIMYTGRLVGDTLGMMTQSESVIVTGGGSSTGTIGFPPSSLSRWGDYSSMSVDPVDDCTFWYTHEYKTQDGQFNWHTRIASFKYPSCSICSAQSPGNVSASPNGANQIDISWNSASGATEYRVYRSQISGGPYSQVGTVTAPSTSYSDTSVSGNVTYYYVVRTYTTCESPYSGEVSATATGTCTEPPLFAGIVSAENGAIDNPCTVNLSWDPGTLYCGGPLTYRVYRDTSSGFTPGPGTQIVSGVTCGSSPCTYADTDALVSGTTYFYVVRAYDASLGAEDTNTVEASAAPNGPNGGIQTLLDEDFENAATWSNWTVTTGPGPYTCGAWERTNSATQMPASGSGYYALSDSDACGSGSQTSTILTSPVVDCSAVTSAGNLSVDIYYKYYDGDDATVEVYDGSAWQVIWSDSDADVNGTLSGDISGYVVGNANFQIRFSYQNAAWDYWFAVDDVLLTGNVDDPCTTGSTCTNPGAVTIGTITDDDSCAQSGITIPFSGGSGASSFDLIIDGSTTVSGVTSPISYDPGDSNSHSYVVRAKDGSCSTDSSSSSFTDETGPGMPSISSITDDDSCVQTGIHVNYTGGTDATSHDLLRNGTPVVIGYTSGALYDPGDSTSYTYTIRANKGSCTATSGGSAFADAADQPGTPSITSITDNDTCAQDGIRVNYNGGSGATSHDLVRDSSVVVSGYASGALYNPGDSSSHSYVVRAVNASCTADSGASSFADTNDGVATPAAPSVSDDDACVQSGVTVSWSSVSGATAYDLFIDGTTTISGVSSPYSYNPGDTTSHNYQVRARNATCTGAYSSATSATDAAGAPTAPAAPAVGDVSSCGLSGVQISWAAVTGATSYDLQIDGGTTVTGVTSPHTYTPGDGNSHSYAVRSVNSCGNSAWSSATAGVDADHSIGGFGGIRTAADRDACEDSGVTLSWKTPDSWNDGGTGSRSFTIQRAGADLQTGIGESVTSGVDTTGTNGTSYAYGVVAINGYGCTSGASTTLSATDNVGSAPSFGGLQSVVTDPGGACSLHLEWNAASSGCSAAPGIVYDVYRSTSSGFTPGAGSLLASCVSDLYYDDSSVLTGTTYYYIVRAEDSSTGHGGSCNGGNEDSNTTEVSAGLSGGATTVTLYSENFDSYADGNYAGWNIGYFSGDAIDWRGVMTCSTSAHSGTKVFRAGGTNCTGNYANNKDSFGAPPTLTIGATWTNVTLSFWHARKMANTDGLSLWIDLDGSGTYTWVDTVHFSVGPYNDTSNGWWDGNATTTMNSVVDLDGACDDFTGGSGGCAGHDIDIAFDLTTDRKNGNDGWFIDDVVITADQPGTACTAGAPDPVEHLTARANSGAVKLEWVNSSTGYASTRICRDTSAFPSDPSTCTQIHDAAGTAGAYDSFTDSGLTNGTTYYYTAWVNNGSGTFSTRETVTARPFATTGKTQWAYSSGASALAPNGVYPGAIGSGATFAVSNDRVLHGMNPTTAGGDWPRTSPYAWEPMAMNGPAQARPPVVPTSVISGADMVVFLGSEDGHAYAANAKTGTTLWQSSALGSILLASPAGMFTAFGGSYDLVFVGSRDAGSANSMYGLRASDGTTAWSFDNGGGGNAIGIISSSAYVDYANNRLYFASRENASGSNNTMWCLSLTGSTSVSLLWSRALGDIDSAPALYDGVVYVGNNAGEVFALDPATGATKWSYATGDGAVKGYVFPQFQAVPRDVYFSTSGSIWALTDSGSSVSLDWQQATISSPSILLAVPGGTDAYAGSSDGKLYQLNMNSGSVVTSLTVGDGTATVGNPVMDVINNMVYVGTESGAVYGVNLPLN